MIKLRTISFFRVSALQRTSALIFVVLSARLAVGQSIDAAIAFQSFKDQFQRDPRVGCGSIVHEAALAKSLVQIGPPLLPLIEREFQRASAPGSNLGFVSVWLEPIYAKIVGSPAFSVLKQRETSSGDGTKRRNLDRALAVSLGITSYVSDTRMAIREISCIRGAGPRSALDQLIVGWLQADLKWLEAALGPVAKTSLQQLILREHWELLRAKLMKGGGSPIAIGFKFNIPNAWRIAEPALESTEAADSFEELPDRSTLAIETVFYGSNGVRCGAMPITFNKIDDNMLSTHQVDSMDIEQLLRLLSTCGTSAH